MKRTLIADCTGQIGQDVIVCGFVQTRRDHGKIAFVDISDRSGLLQTVVGGDIVADISPQDVLRLSGKIVERPQNLVNKLIPTGNIELQVAKIEILAKAAQLPFDMGAKELDLQLPTLLDLRALTLRHPQVKAIFKIQAKILEGFRKVARELDCEEIVVPEIAIAASEGGAEVFKVDYYGHKATMTQSPQLYKQMLVPVFERVFTVAHAYRAEPSVTTRHLSVSTQMDCEFGFVDFEDLLDLLEKVGIDVLKYVEETCKKELDFFGVEKIAFSKVPRLTLKETQEIIFQEFGRDVRNEKDLSPQDEVDICNWALQKHGSDLVTITHFPTAKRAFYSMPDPQDPQHSLSYDLLFRGVEILSGSQRIHELKQLEDAIKERGMNPEDFEMYFQAFKYGMPPEGGFSFGLERITMNVLKLKNIREASLFPRDMERVDVRLSTFKK